MAPIKEPNGAIKLAVIEVKIDGIKSDAASSQITMKAHIDADAVAFKEVLMQLDVLKAFRWQMYGAIVVIGAIMGAIEWFRIMRLVP